MKAILAKADTEDRSRTAEEVAEYTKLEAEWEALNADIEARSTIEVLETRSARTNSGPGPGRRTQPEQYDITKDMTEKEIEEYDLGEAVRCVVEGRPLPGIVEEVNRAMSVHSPKPATIKLPLVLASRKLMGRKAATRAVDATTAAGLKETHFGTSDYIEGLYKQTVLNQLGVTRKDGLVGTYVMPRMSGGATVYDVQNSGSATASNATFDKITFTPKRMGIRTYITRDLFVQSNLNVTQEILTDIQKQGAIGLETRVLNGSGTGGQITGILNMEGVEPVAAGSGLFDDLVAMETAVAIANADVGNLAYLTTNYGRGKLKTTLESEAAGSEKIWHKDNTINGYRAFASNTIANIGSSGGAANVLFGNWSDCVVATWSTLDILLNPYAADDDGGIKILAFLDYDMQLRHDESFVSYTLDY